MQTWVFLRGLSRESRHWGDFIEQFQLGIPDSEVVSLDLPGNGLLNQQRSPLHVEAMVSHCRTQLASRGVKPPFHVLALSLGGMVAVAWSEAYPQEISATVLVNSSMRPFNPFYERLLPANYQALLKLSLLGGTSEKCERIILRLTSNHPDERVLPYWISLRHERPVSRYNALRQLIAAARFSAAAVKRIVPTLVLGSEHDHLVSVECSKTMAQYWHCALHIHPTAGHDLPLDDGPWITKHVFTWLNNQ